MRLDVYRSCSRQEKVQVLEAFWRSHVKSSDRIHLAAVQYGPYAVICLVAVAVELAVIIALALSRAIVIGLIAILLEVVAVTSLWWALVRTRAVRRDFTLN
ncbi:MAG: hypothetical protein JWM55_71 [Acidimicrobiaceae bacterium]|nr:hypothetical protein [Acidimicrobiaceae bacterium]